MTDKQLSQQESLALISDMIQQAKNNYQKGSSFYFLLWGWTIAIANFSHYYLASFTNFDDPQIVWIVTIPAGIISGIYGYNQRKNANVTSHIDRLYTQVWIAVGLGIVVSILYMNRLEFNHSAIIMLFAGIGTYISGQMLRFKPLVIGGFVLIIAGVICFNVPVTEQYLVSGMALIAGYLIPGYMLKSKEK